LRLCDGRQRHAARESQRRGVRATPLRRHRGPDEPVPGLRAGSRRSGHGLSPGSYRELWTRARDGGGRRPVRRHDRAAGRAARALAAANRFAYDTALTMQGLVIRWLVSAVSLYLTSLIVRGIEIDGIFPLLFAAVTIGILNAVVRPVILLLT